MLTIRSAQMEAFRELAKAEFAKRLSAFLERKHPDWDPALRVTRVRQWMVEAEKFAIRRECDVARYVELAAEYWPNSSLPKGLVRIIAAREVIAAERLARAAEWLAEETSD